MGSCTASAAVRTLKYRITSSTILGIVGHDGI